MKSEDPFFSLPLLTRELTERAAQGRTYVMRTLYAVLLFALFLFAYVGISHRPNLTGLGLGKPLLFRMTALQFAGIFIFLPAIMCGSIAGERERGTLSLLLLTRLTPWEIIIQKLIGGLVPMFSFLLLSLPLAGLAYNLGAVTVPDLLNTSLFLFSATVVLGAISLFASAWCRTAVGAYVAYMVISGAIMSLIFWFAWFIEVMNDMGVARPLSVGIIASGMTILALAGARIGLLRFASLPAHWSVAADLDESISVPRVRRALPLHRPVFWREQTRNVLMHPRHLVRIALILECLVGLVALGIIFHAPTRNAAISNLDFSIAIVGVMAVLAVSALGASAFVSERLRRTLDVLLTTPLNAADIIAQKASAMRRLLIAGMVPAATLIAIELVTRLDSSGRDTEDDFIFAAAAFGCFAIGLPLVWWIAVLLTIKMRSQAPALLLAVGAILGFLLLPIVAREFLRISIVEESSVAAFFAMVSPMESLRMIGGRNPANLPSWFRLAAPIFQLGILGAFLGAVRQHCLDRAEQYLRG